MSCNVYITAKDRGFIKTQFLGGESAGLPRSPLSRIRFYLICNLIRAGLTSNVMHQIATLRVASLSAVNISDIEYKF
jgi:hypothetical protein